MNALLPTLALLALCPFAAPHSPVPRADDEPLQEIARRLRVANAAHDAEKRKAALDELIALGDADGVEVLIDAYATSSRQLREARRTIVRSTYELEQKRVLIEEMRVRAEQRSELRKQVEDLAKEIGELEVQLDKAQRSDGRETECCAELGAAVTRLFDVFGAHKTRKLEDSIWGIAEEPGDGTKRIGAIEVLGRIGGPGTAARLQRILVKNEADRVKLKKKLPEAEQAARALEKRIQDEQEAHNGQFSRATADQYERVRREAADLRRDLHALEHVSDAAVEGAGRALGRETPEALPGTLKELVRAQRNARDGVRMQTLEIFARGAKEPVLATMRELLEKEKEPLARAAWIDGLARAGDASIVPALLSTHLVDDAWHVRARAIDALAKLRSRDAIGVLIERLAVEDGRLQGDVNDALQSLTGQRFASRPELWRQWWQDNAAGFEVPPAPADGYLSAALEGVGTSFFGIPLESDRVLFVLDVSGSMNEPMFQRSGTGDPEREGETRLSVAKRELTKAISSIANGGVFNVVLYAADVENWQNRLVVMDDETRAEVLAWLAALNAVGGTNVYGAMQRAFDVAEVEEGDTWSDPRVDTIFLLSDGQPSVGVTTDAEEILAMVAERNRSAGIVINTIGISNEHNAYLMRSLAEQNEGTYAAR